MPPDSFVSLAPAVTLQLHPPAQVVGYEAEVIWASYANGDYQASTIRKQIALAGQANDKDYALELRTSPPVLTKPEDLESMEEMALRLAALYARLVMQVTSTGEWVALLNHEAVLQTWVGLEEEIQATTGVDNEVTATILAFVSKQLRNPDDFLRSLQHDYLYQTLVPDFYGQRLGGDAPGRERQFANFFDKNTLWFWEQAAVLPSETPDQLTLRLTGTLNAQKTDVAAIVALINKDLTVAQPPAGTPPVPASLPAPHFAYEATYVVELATGLPITVELTVYARVGLLYNKQYTLFLSRS